MIALDDHHSGFDCSCQVLILIGRSARSGAHAAIAARTDCSVPSSSQPIAISTSLAFAAARVIPSAALQRRVGRVSSRWRYTFVRRSSKPSERYRPLAASRSGRDVSSTKFKPESLGGLQQRDQELDSNVFAASGLIDGDLLDESELSGERRADTQHAIPAMRPSRSATIT